MLNGIRERSQFMSNEDGRRKTEDQKPETED
jgi:hypothetical protein